MFKTVYRVVELVTFNVNLHW